MPVLEQSAERHSTLSLGVAVLFTRLALAAGFLSAVAERAGLWGGEASDRATTFAAVLPRLDVLVPAALQPSVVWAATGLELVLGLLLLFGLWPRGTAVVSGLLLLLLAAGVALASPGAVLDGYVLAAAAAAFLLAALPRRPAYAVPAEPRERLRYASPLA